MPRYRKQQVNWRKYRLQFADIKERPERRNNCSGFYMGTYFRSQREKGKPKQNTVSSKTLRDGNRCLGHLEWHEFLGRVPDRREPHAEKAPGTCQGITVPDTALGCDPCEKGNRQGERHGQTAGYLETVTKRQRQEPAVSQS